VYRRAHLSLDTTRMTVDAVVARIVRHLRDRERLAGLSGTSGDAPAEALADGSSSVDLPAGVAERQDAQG
jgi:hypothetical protein